MHGIQRNFRGFCTGMVLGNQLVHFIYSSMACLETKLFSRTGSMDGACMTSAEELPPPTGKGPTRPCLVTPLNGSMPHALLYDLTHDNESYLDKRSAEDALSTGALVAFSYSAIGSVKGFDDLYPQLLNLVQEKRRYAITHLDEDSGIAKAKRVLNELRREMVLDGYEEGHVHQENDVSAVMQLLLLLLI